MSLIYKLAFIILGSLLANLCYAQKEAFNWVFGYQCGFNFNDGAPATFSSKIKSNGGGAVISDKITGELLFYTDGRNFWNGDHELMQNIYTRPVDCWTIWSQGALILPSSINPQQYHVFCIRPEDEITASVTNCWYTSTGEELETKGLNLYYYLVDMSLENGSGNIVEEKSNLLLKEGVTEKLTAIPHSNGTDYWVLTHDWGTNAFNAMLLTGDHVDNTVVTNIGSIHGANANVVDPFEELSGSMIASPNGKKIACAVSLGKRPFDLFDFDASSGMLSNYINLGQREGQHGVSFSPDNTKLYVTSDGQDPTDPSKRSIIVQYNLSAGSSENIVSSGKSIIVGNPNTNIPPSGVFDGFGYSKKGMALGPDGRLYVSGNDSMEEVTDPHVMVIIENPNGEGYSCNVNYYTFDFKDSRIGIGLPNFMQSYFNNIPPIGECEDLANLSVYPNPSSGKYKLKTTDGCSTSYHAELFNSLGQSMMNLAEVNSETEFDLTRLPDGIYLLIFTNYRNSKATQRLIKISGKMN